jgi:hypothetical protein
VSATTEGKVGNDARLPYRDHRDDWELPLTLQGLVGDPPDAQHAWEAMPS